MRGDDAVGPIVAESLREQFADNDHVDVLTLGGESTRLIEAFRDRSLAVLIDAVRAGSEPGTIHRIEPLIDGLPSAAGAATSHNAGVAEALALAAQLNALPQRVVVFGIEPATFELGHDCSPSVREAIPELRKQVGLEALT